MCERKRRRPLDKSESHKQVSVFTSGCVRVLFFIFINNDFWMDGWDGMGWDVPYLQILKLDLTSGMLLMILPATMNSLVRRLVSNCRAVGKDPHL